MVKHLMDEEGNILSFADFHERFLRGIGFSHLSRIGFVSNDVPEEEKTPNL